jgi:glycosyltransferase involved in cell wall biosynthesis
LSAKRPAPTALVDGLTAETPSIGFVVARYGADVLGGAETYCRLLAENLSAAGHDVTVLTTCATDGFTWANARPAGESLEGGVRVRRFAVGPRDNDEWLALHGAIDSGQAVSYAEQIEWMAESVWSPGLLDEAAHHDRYGWLVAIPYMFGTTFWTAAAFPDRTVVIPCFHDEPHARLPSVLDALTTARGLMMNTATERALLANAVGGVFPERVPSVLQSPVVSVGYDPLPPPSQDDVIAFCARHDVKPGYLMYAGRREEGKGVGRLFDLYRGYVDKVPRPRPLALIGRGPLAIPEDLRPHIIDFGFLPDTDMAPAYAAAGVFVHPSRMESLGMVLLEAWNAGTPALVDAHSPVLMEHCVNSGGGLWWSSPAEFIEAVEILTEDEDIAAAVAARGREYVQDVFRWDAVRARFFAALESWA